MGLARRVKTDIGFNGQEVSGMLDGYVESVTYEDVAKDSSDTIDIQLQNINMRWLDDWFPAKGDRMRVKFTFQNWNGDGEDFSVFCGSFVLDDISFSGNPRTGKLSGLALPANASFVTLERSKIWKKITVKKIATTIGRRYRMTLTYNAPKITVAMLEQSVETDSAFLYKLCETYNLGMKVYNNKLVIYDPGQMERKASVATLTPTSFVNSSWEFDDTLTGIYNGARIAFKKSENSTKTKTIYLGKVKENSEDARTLRISETANSRADAKYKACAAINKANEEATTLKGSIWPDPRITAGCCVVVKDFGFPDGKYFVDKMTMEVSNGGAKMSVEMHKVQQRIRRV